MDSAEHVTNKNYFIGKKGVFAPLRYYVHVPDIETCSIILHLRDPRDVLVSMFYSYCYSHSGSINGYTGYRKETADQGIDNFVLRMVTEENPNLIGDYGVGPVNIQNVYIGNIKKRYEKYIYKFINRKNVIFVKCEEMVTDYKNWIAKVIVPFDIPNKSIVIDELSRSWIEIINLLKPKQENIWIKVRKMLPRDYKAKLKPETISELNQVLKDILKALTCPDYCTTS